MTPSQWDFNRGPLEVSNPETGEPYTRPMYLYIYLKNAYYKGRPIMSDTAFDAFEALIRKEFPEYPPLSMAGEIFEEEQKEASRWIWKRKTKQE